MNNKNHCLNIFGLKLIAKYWMSDLEKKKKKAIISFKFFSFFFFEKLFIKINKNKKKTC